MKNRAGITTGAVLVIAAAVLAGCKEFQPRTISGTRGQELAPIADRLETPVDVSSSALLGLTKAQVLKTEGVKELKSEHGAPDKKWFSGGIVHFPSVPGDSYVIERCHVLTFQNGKVVKHEMLDRATAHIGNSTCGG